MMTRLGRGLGGVALGAWLALCIPTPSSAAVFELSTTIRAGRENNADWELGIGPLGNNAAFTAQVNSPNYYPNGLPNRFEIGYTSSTNSAFVRYYYAPGLYRQATYAPGGPGLGGSSMWTIPVGSLFVSAASRPRPTSVTMDQLALSGGVQVLQPFSTTSLTASQDGFNSLASMGNTVVFRTGASGNWLLSGRISFSGLQAYTPGGAQRSQLQLIGGFSGASVPETRTSILIALGLVAFWAIGRTRHRVGGPWR